MMLNSRTFCTIVSGLALIVTMASAQDRRPSSPAPSTNQPMATQAQAPKHASPFPDGGRSGQPCEFLGPCGRCDCPPSIGRQSEADKKK
jgi:hypothetical protein